MPKEKDLQNMMAEKKVELVRLFRPIQLFNQFNFFISQAKPSPPHYSDNLNF